MTDLSITSGGSLADGHNIQHVTSTDKDRKPAAEIDAH
jgi:hypothetical protein